MDVTMSDGQPVMVGRVEAFVRWTTYAVVTTPVISVGIGLALSNNLLIRYPAAMAGALALSIALSACNVAVVRRSVRSVVEASTLHLHRGFLILWITILAATCKS